MTTLVQDFRFAFRLLWQNKTFTSIAVLALALGIGPNTAIFSVIYATFYAPMPYPHAEQIVMVWSKIQGNRNGVAAGDYLDWRTRARRFRAYGRGRLQREPGRRRRTRSRCRAHSDARVAPGLACLQCSAAISVRKKAQAGKDHVVIFGNKLWVNALRRQAGIIGQPHSHER